jgi:hypothetical protein
MRISLAAPPSVRARCALQYGAPASGNSRSSVRLTTSCKVLRTPLPTCKQAVHEEHDDCANYGTN